MFISEDEAKRRQEDERNIFSEVFLDKFRRYQESQWKTPSTSGNGDAPAAPDSEKEGPSEATIDNLLTGAVDPYQVKQRRGNLQGQTDVQVAIGVTSTVLGNKAAGTLFGLSMPQTDAYENGYSSHDDKTYGIMRKPERLRQLKTVKEQIASVAATKLNRALTSLTDEKLDNLSPMKASTLAKDMAVIMDKVSKDHHKAESVHFHIFRPEMRSIGDYATVHVSSPVVVNPDGGDDR